MRWRLRGSSTPGKRIAYLWQELDWSIELFPIRERSLEFRSVDGVAISKTRTIKLWITPADPVGAVTHVVTPEIGHAVDITRLTDHQRHAFMRACGLPRTTSWWSRSTSSVVSSDDDDWGEVGSEVYGEHFACHLLGDANHDGRLSVGPPSREPLATLHPFSWTPAHRRASRLLRWFGA